jgi:hypothetical protein
MPVIAVITVITVIVIASYVARFIFFRSDEIYGAIARVIFVAVLAPVSRMPRRHVQINRWRRRGLTLNDHRLGVHERRRTFISDTHLTVNARGDLSRKYDVYIESVSSADSDRCYQARGKHD